MYEVSFHLLDKTLRIAYASAIAATTNFRQQHCSWGPAGEIGFYTSNFSIAKHLFYL
jgi:hypothetical protein